MSSESKLALARWPRQANLAVIWLVAIGFCGCEDDRQNRDLALPIGHLISRSQPHDPIVPLPASGQFDAKSRLGKLLFHDPRLSHDNTISCASCHDIAHGGDDGRSLAVGIGGAGGTLNSPSVLNATYNIAQFWDGRAQKLESVGQLAAGIAHEINTPMQYVGDNVQFVQSSLHQLDAILQLLVSLDRPNETSSPVTLDAIRQSIGKVNLMRLIDQMPKAIDDAQQGIDNMARIIVAMKEFSHPGTALPTALDINRVLESTVVVSKCEWKYVAEVELSLDPQTPSIAGFANELQQVFLNLVVNAAHAVEARGRADEEFQGKIRVTSSYQNDRCLVTIEDNGCGIPHNIRNRVYDPFFTTKEVGKGTGQGLAIAHQVIVNKHHGKLWLESEEGVGTTFFIELPIETSLVMLPEPQSVSRG